MGKAFGPHSAHVHTPIPGRVTGIVQAEDIVGEPCTAVVVDLEGEFERSGRDATSRPWEAFSRFELLAQVQAAGVVDRGGAREPAHLALALAPGGGGQARGERCRDDPALSCTSALLREKPREIVEGTRIAMKILGLSAGALIAVSEADAGLVPAFERAIDSTGALISVRVVSARYPQGHAQLLLSALDWRASARDRPPGEGLRGRGHPLRGHALRRARGRRACAAVHRGDRDGDGFPARAPAKPQGQVRHPHHGPGGRLRRAAGGAGQPWCWEGR